MASQNRLDQVRDLVNQWEQIVGYRVGVPDWAVDEMADMLTVSSLYDLGQYMRHHAWGDDPAFFVSGDVFTNMPWAMWGMSPAEYSRKLEGFDAAFRTLTGQVAPPDLVDQALHQHQGVMSGQQFETWLLAQDAIKNQYGWLKYGLDFNQFQTKKLQMRTGFGRDLSDEEVVTQLQYHHAAQGPNVGVTAQAQQTQQERKQAQVGIGGSVVR